MPQLVGQDVYKYLGTELPTGWANGKAQEVTRTKVRSKCRSLLGMLASIPVLTDQQLGLAMVGTRTAARVRATAGRTHSAVRGREERSHTRAESHFFQADSAHHTARTHRARARGRGSPRGDQGGHARQRGRLADQGARPNSF